MSYYAVRVGRIPGIYSTWADCQAQVSGYSGAEFKKFSTREAALEFINTTTSSYYNLPTFAGRPTSTISSNNITTSSSSSSVVRPSTQSSSSTSTSTQSSVSTPATSVTTESHMFKVHLLHNTPPVIPPSQSTTQNADHFTLTMKTNPPTVLSFPTKFKAPPPTQDETDASSITLHVYIDGSGKTGNSGMVVYQLGTNNKLTEIAAATARNPQGPYTNQRAELYALVYACQYLLKIAPNAIVTIHSDSHYTIKSVTEWCHKWDYTNYAGLQNRELLMEVVALFRQVAERHILNIKYVAGHSGNFGNDRADFLASQTV